MSDHIAMFEPAWPGGDDARKPDTRVAFRGSFTLLRSCTVDFRILGASWFTAWLDEEFLTEGPARFPPSHPEYEAVRRTLGAGRHVVGAIVHHHGVETRMLRGDIPPFFWCQAREGMSIIELRWKATRLAAYKASGVRINPQFAWIDWCDTRELPENWERIEFDDSSWAAPVAQNVSSLGEFRAVRIGSIRHSIIAPKLIAQGMLTGPFDSVDLPKWVNEGDPSWYKRQLHPATAPTGAWRRYDLGRVRLGVPEIEIELPPGAVVEMAHSESLTSEPIFDGYEQKVVATFDDPIPDARVAPYIPLSAGVSRNLDHFIARGGVQTFAPSSPRGGRFVEIHVQADPSHVKFLRERFIDRAYFGEPLGSFECHDERLNRIWTLGIDTLRACSEDAIIDNPTRERGQWTGDVLLSMYIAASAYGDLRLFRRGIEQSAFSARDDGLVAGLNPGGPAFLATYAAQWVTSVLNYFDLTGDVDLLEEMYPFALRNLDAFEKKLGPEGIDKTLAWCFIDWGYPASDGPSDLALNVHVYEALTNMMRWSNLAKQPATRYEQLAAKLRTIIDRAVATDFDALGYHKTVLALRGGFVAPDRRRAGIEFIKRHILDCFPNNPDAPRLANPKVTSARLITPYFSYYAFPVLIESGEMDFVLDQWRTCWGWGLAKRLTTQPEVFDLGWSHCHAWASSPTAQMTQYLLGLRARFSGGVNHFDLRLIPGSLKHARGTVPIPFTEDVIEVDWERQRDGAIRYRVQSPCDAVFHDLARNRTIELSRGRARVIHLSAEQAPRLDGG